MVTTAIDDAAVQQTLAAMCAAAEQRGETGANIYTAIDKLRPYFGSRIGLLKQWVKGRPLEFAVFKDSYKREYIAHLALDQASGAGAQQSSSGPDMWGSAVWPPPAATGTSAAGCECTVCSIRFGSEADFWAHVVGKWHKEAVAQAQAAAEASNLFSGLSLDSRQPLDSRRYQQQQHYDYDYGGHHHHHQQQHTNGGYSSSSRQHQTSAGPFYCDLCRTTCNYADGFAAHKAGRRHQVLQLQRSLKGSGGLFGAKFGVQVSALPELKDLEVGKPQAVSLTVVNMANEDRRLERVTQLRPVAEVVVLPGWGDEAGGGGGGRLLPHGASVQLTVVVTPTNLGVISTLMVLDFGGFAIGRHLQTLVDANDPTMPDLRPTAPYKKQRQQPARPAKTVVPGERPPRQRGGWLNPPKHHPVSRDIQKLFNDGHHAELKKRLDWEAANLSGHAAKMRLLVELEELQQHIDITRYSMRGVELEVSGRRYLALQVPGLAENRPSVLKGDALYVRPHESPDSDTEFQGFVHEVRREEVLLRFNAGFHQIHINGRKWDVRFSIKRSTFVFLHEALSLLQEGRTRGEMVLPPGVVVSSVTGWRPMEIERWVNRQLNAEQQQAVRHVVDGAHGAAPYLIFGPPGTGKTSTLIEAAAQVLRVHRTSRLLLVAPSNSAADLLAQRLIAAGRPQSEVLRLCAYQRPKESLPAELLDVTTWSDDDGAFVLPEVPRITASKTRVVVVTCLMAAKIYARGVPPGHFGWIMFDEAGHAEEPLALAAVAGLAGHNTKLVLAGDPRQLGPVILSPLARYGGLDVSLMERLIARAPYAPPEPEGPYNPVYITQLVQNYRSHPALLALPNKLFYHNSLQACADPQITDTLLHWEKLPNKEFPFLFHGVEGEDQREGNSPSWFNPVEAKLVVQYVEALINMRGKNRVAAAQIGIITPYRKQVQKLQITLRSKGFSSIKVGSVEEFQGQERRVIIISTVRSSVDWLDFDAKHRLGFVASPKRFNVALTRAQALVIVVGNPLVLVGDRCWRAMLKMAADNGACVGKAPPPEVYDADADADAAAAGGAAAGGGRGGGSDQADLDAMEAMLRKLNAREGEGPGQVEEGEVAAMEGGGMRRLM